MNATMEQTVQQFKWTILDQIRHTTLQSYTGEPLFQDEQLFFILLPQLNGEQWSVDIINAAVATAIVHTSLHEHDRILAKEAVTKEQQLTVLSGDYYSGRYYQLLAQTGNVLLIQKLSAAIIERCEHEIKVYEQVSRSQQDWIDSLEVIKTALIERFYSVFGFEAYSPIMKQALTIHSLRKVQKMEHESFMQQIVEAGPLNQVIEKRSKQLEALLEEANYTPSIKQQILAIIA